MRHPQGAACRTPAGHQRNTPRPTARTGRSLAADRCLPMQLNEAHMSDLARCRQTYSQSKTNTARKRCLRDLGMSPIDQAHSRFRARSRMPPTRSFASAAQTILSSTKLARAIGHGSTDARFGRLVHTGQTGASRKGRTHRWLCRATVRVSEPHKPLPQRPFRTRFTLGSSKKCSGSAQDFTFSPRKGKDSDQLAQLKKRAELITRA